MNDPYSTLGVPFGASPDECKTAYRKLAKKYHPDVNGGDPAAAERFKEISAAYEAITNPQPDPQPHPDFNFGFGGGFGGHSPFEDLFAHMAGMNRRRDVTVEIRLTLEEAFTGKDVTAQAPNGDGAMREVKVKVPAGIEDGVRLMMQRAGPVYQGRPSDIYFLIRVMPHTRFARQGLNLLQTVPVSALDVLLGDDIEVACITGQTIRVAIPDNWDSRRKLRLAGQGMTNGQTRGDMLIDLFVQYPPLSVEQRDAIRQILRAGD